MSKWFFITAMGSMFLLLGCDYVEALYREDEQVSRSMSLKPFDEVVIGTSVNLILCDDSIFQADIEGLAFVLSRLKIKQEQGILYIETDGPAFRKKQAPVVILHATSFKKLTSNFAAEIGAKDTLKSDRFAMVINGGGSFTETHLTIKANRFSLFCYGSNVGTHVFKGQVESFRVISEGLTAVDARALEADKVEYVQRSISPAYVFAQEHLEVKMESAGDVFFLGHPQVNVDYQPSAYKMDLGQVLSWSSIN